MTREARALSQKVADFLDKIMRQNKEIESIGRSEKRPSQATGYERFILMRSWSTADPIGGTASRCERLNRRYRDYAVEADPVPGTYGLIWFPTGKSLCVLPGTFAVKATDPEKIVLDQRVGADRHHLPEAIASSDRTR